MKLLVALFVGLVAVLGVQPTGVGAAEPNEVMRVRVDDCVFGLRYRDALRTGRPEASVIVLNESAHGGVCVIQRPSVNFVRADGSPGGWSPGGQAFRRRVGWLYSTAFREDPSATAVGGDWVLTKVWWRGGRDYCAQQKFVFTETGDGARNGQLLEDTGRFPLFPGAVCP